MMINEERKMEYLETLKSKETIRNVRHSLERISFFEERFGKDCCNFIRSEILETFTSMNLTSTQSIASKRSIYGMYTSWAIMNGYSIDGMNHYKELTVEDDLKCVNLAAYNKTIFSKGIVQDMIESLENPSDKFLILAPFEAGILGNSYSEITELTRSGIDVENSTFTFKCTNRTVKVSKQLLDIALESYDTYEYYSILKDSVLNYRKTSEYIVKPRDNTNEDRVKSSALKTRMIYIKNYLDTPSLSFPRLVMSGVVMELNNISKEKGIPIRQIIHDDIGFNDVMRKYNLEESKGSQAITRMYSVLRRIEDNPSLLG